jgi:hypothetical protein
MTYVPKLLYSPPSFCEPGRASTIPAASSELIPVQKQLAARKPAHLVP